MKTEASRNLDLRIVSGFTLTNGGHAESMNRFGLIEKDASARTSSKIACFRTPRGYDLIFVPAFAASLNHQTLINFLNYSEILKCQPDWVNLDI